MNTIAERRMLSCSHWGMFEDSRRFIVPAGSITEEMIREFQKPGGIMFIQADKPLPIPIS